MVDGVFELGMSINLGNYSSIQMKVIGINGTEARNLIRQEASENIKLAKDLMKETIKI